MEKIFDIAIVATLRPELLERTIKSFVENLWGKDWLTYLGNVYVNVDKDGAEEKDAPILCHTVERFLRKYFGDIVVINFKEAHFPTAWLWGIQQTTADYVFHLEEDWLLNYPHDFGEMLSMFYKYPSLKHLRFNYFKSGDVSTKLWQKYFAHWNGNFFEIGDEAVVPVGWCGHPSLNDGKWLRALAKDINPAKNPEKQFHYHPDFVNKWVIGNQFGIFQPRNADRAITDIGRQWMAEHGYRKTGGINVEWFTHWEKSNPK